MNKLGNATRMRIGHNLDRLYSYRNGHRFASALRAAAPDARVAVGVGKRPIADWINTDVTRSVGIFLDITRPWPDPQHSASHIYMEHVIEHFTLNEGRLVFRSCLAGLAKGGRLRLVTPDLERAARAYLDRSEVGMEHLAYYRPSRVAEHPTDLIRMLYSYDNHWMGYIYDFDSLRVELENAGFQQVRRMNPGESEDPVFRNLEARVDRSFFHMQLVVEAEVPS
jgi:predicted SAM-dependent methyltransferase